MPYTYQNVFKRYELKYLLTKEQKARVLDIMDSYMLPDEYGKTAIRNLYYDTDNFLLARKSIERPVYKEKLRVRSYEQTTGDSTVFVELKKKYETVVYKRRIALPERAAMEWMEKGVLEQPGNQISKEIDYFLDFYKTLKPVMFLSYEREAYYSKEQSDFRITFDERILGRENNLSLGADIYGEQILPEDRTLMEIKCSGGIPLWMTSVLSEESIYKTSFSKYGTAYKSIIYQGINM